MKGRVNASILNVRVSTESKSKIAGRLKKNDVVKVLEKTGTWLKIEYQQEQAFVVAKFVDKIGVGKGTF